MPGITPITLVSLRGGMNDTDPANSLPDDQCVNATNVEFFSSAVGERRAGCDPLDPTNSNINGSSITVATSVLAAWGAIGLSLVSTGAIGFDNAASGGSGANTNTLTVAYTVGASANYLVVGVVGDVTSDFVTGVTFNAVGMTLLKKFNPGNSVGWLYVFGLATPATGTHNIVVSASSNCNVLGCDMASYLNLGAAQPESPGTTITTALASSMSITTSTGSTSATTWAFQFSRRTTGAFIAVTGGVLRVSQSGGASAGTIVDSNSPAPAQTVVNHLSQWFPTNDVSQPELWAMGATPNGSVPVALARRTMLLTGTATWFQVIPDDPVIPVSPDLYKIDSQALSGLLLWAYNSGIDRLHVWDGTFLRRTGLAQPTAAPTAVDHGAGAYATKRYFRTRWISKTAAGVITRRSEPSLSVAFTPSGGGDGATITNSPTIGEHETHWELEGSLDNSLFYRIQTLTAATTTALDTTPGTGYATVGPLSEAIGAYLLQPSFKFLAIDGDRLLMAGHWTNPALQSTVAWTPASGDPGVGSAERLPIVTTGGQAIANTLDLDNYVGGAITGIASGVLAPTASSTATPVSVWYVFKWTRIYMLISTGNIAAAYSLSTISTSRGAIPGSIFNGVDETGASCIYFLDPLLGPSRIGPNGLQLMVGLRKTWARVNLQAKDVIACGGYYPYKQQAHWWVAADGNNTPSLKLISQTSELRSVPGNAVTRGWSLANGRLAQALCCEPYTEFVGSGASTSLSTRLFIGLTAPDYIQRTDVDSTDAGQTYAASILTRPYFLAGLLDRVGALAVTLLATANSLASAVLRIIRDQGVETGSVETLAFTPQSSETAILQDLDDATLSGCRSIQLQISDT
jgi:hypothetical protein